MKKILFLLFALIILQGCGSHTPPKNVNNICDIFFEIDDWFDAAKDSSDEWGVPIPVMLAIMHQESRFQAAAKPPRKTFLWIFPGFRQSSAYGYSQALDGTWEEYKESSGNSWADRDEFEDAIDFIGWYCDQSSRRSGIAKNDAYNLYLAYHEGQGGYNRGTYKKKKGLLKIARKVKARSQTYQKQLTRCREELESNSWSIWPF